ncbi:MAG TPA: hypothetical protein VN915_01205 [Elusimicrobiota bacterium]|nr:hypothetical protein [Elusimicrobiota bacterium]
MAMLEPDVPPERKKKTIWLLAGGAASLLIPLAGAIYLHVSQNSGPTGPTGRSDVFERREGDDKKIMPTQSAVVTAPPALMSPVASGMVAGVAQKPTGSSLDFIQGGAELRAKLDDAKAAPQAPAAAPAASTATAAPDVAAPPPARAKKTKPGRKEFTMPKLQPTRGFTNFSSSSKKTAGASSGGGQDAQSLLNGLPPGAENDPRIQAYLKAHQGQ